MRVREKMRGWFLLWFICLLVAVGACGKKGRPIPMDALVPRSVYNFQIKRMDGAIRLSWKEPKKDLRGRKLKNLAGYKVLKKVVKPGSNYCIDCPAGFSEVAVLDRDNPVNFREEDGTIVWEDRDLGRPGTYVYRIVPFNSDGYDGVASGYLSVKMP